MISEDMEFRGFDARSWNNLLSLFERQRPEDGPSGWVVVVENEDGEAALAFHSERGPLPRQIYGGRDQLQSLCESQHVSSCMVVTAGAVDELTDRAAERIDLDADYLSQWLTLIGVARELQKEQRLLMFPDRSQVPLPSPAMVEAALERVLPDGHCWLAAIWDGPDLWSAVSLRRRGGCIDQVAGPDLISAWAGPLGGDYRRDHRALSRGVSRHAAPVHMGVFAQRQTLDELLKERRPGAWARAVAVREMIIEPAPAYVTVAVGADAARAAAQVAKQWLGGMDMLSMLEPAAGLARSRIRKVSSLTDTLGFNPLQALARRLRDD